MNITSHKKRKKISDTILEILTYSSTIITCIVLISIVVYIFSKGLKGINFKFLSSTYSEGDSSQKGILPMMINTMYTIVVTMLIIFPFGIGTAIYTTQYSKSKFFNKMISFSSDILSGLPSVIFGLFGYSLFCLNFGLGTSILAGCLTMSICVLPSIVRSSEEALKNVPSSYKEAAYALGAKRLRVIFTITLPTSLPEIFTSMFLCIGKILGESAIFVYTVGMAYSMPKGLISHLFSSGRTLTLHLYQIARQANTEDALDITFATASVLLILVVILNLCTDLILRFIYHENKK